MAVRRPFRPSPSARRRRAADAEDDDRMLEGVIHLTRQGYGFLEVDPRPEDNPRGDNDAGDVKIDEEHLGGALHGDRVRARLFRERRDLRRRGMVLEILARARTRFVAVTLEPDRVRAEDERNPYVFRLDPAGLDPDRPLRRDWKVLVDVTEWPGSDARPGRDQPLAKLVEVLGPAGAADTETAAVLAALGIESDFPEDAIAAARALPQALSADERARRLDLTGLVAVTIDPDDARDFDDALSLEILPNGNRRVGVHIADVSLAAPPGSALDRTARDRGVSVYLPDRAIPMLPPEAANNLCSLRPDEDRAAKTVFLEYDADGQRVAWSAHRSVIRSVRRFTYGEVRDLLDPDHIRAPRDGDGDGAETPARPPAPLADLALAKGTVAARRTSESGRLAARRPPPRPSTPAAEVFEALRGLDELAQQLRRRRFAAGSVELDLTEIRVRLDDDGKVAGIEKQAQDFSHQLVEEFMLAANQVVGEWAVAVGAGVLHRVHEAPSPERFAELCDYLGAIGLVLKPPPDRRRINALLERVRGQPEERGVNMAVLRAFAQACYAPDADVGHFALAFPRYVHFTSPIRRYPDLHLHQAIDSYFPEDSHRLPRRPRDREINLSELAALGAHCSERERRAMKAEMETAEFRRLQWLAENEGGRTLNAVVTGVKKFGVFVEVDGYYVEGLLPKAMVEEAGFVLREEPPPHPASRPAANAAGAARPAKTPKTRRWAGGRGFWLGQTLRVRIASVDLAERRCRLELASRG